MKNGLIDRFKNTITVKIKGKNIERFMKRLVKLNTDLLRINYIKYNEIIIRIKKEDLERLEEAKTIYEVEVLDVHGMDKIKMLLLKNKYVIISIIISIIILIYLCNTIFSVEVVHNNPEIREIILEELKLNGIENYKLKKSYDELQKIKKSIIEKYKDQIEWLEIESVGTKYIVRVEERILNKEDSNYLKRDIIAKKDALILNVDAKKGEIVVSEKTYVKKGQTIITGDIKLYEESKNQIMAEGEVYGEVWYKATVEYPLRYKEETLTGKRKKVLVFKFLNYEIEFFNFHKFKFKRVEEEHGIKHLFLPISLTFQDQKELTVIDEDLTPEEATEKAIEKAKNKIENKLSEKEYIIDTKKLKVEQNNSKIIVEVFFSVCENITDYKEIVENIEMEEIKEE